MLTAAFLINQSAHQQQHALVMAAGLERHGVRCRFQPYGDMPAECDLAVVWGWRQPLVAKAAAAGHPVLVMERGHLPDRLTWTSCGWATPAGGLGRHARYACVDDGGRRFLRNWSHLVRPWHLDWGKSALVCGQVKGDAALGTTDIHAWAQQVVEENRNYCGHTLYRPHPFSIQQGDYFCPVGAELSLQPDLHADLARSKFVVTWTDSAAVESVLAGVPTVAMDEGSMAWDVAAHSIRDVGRLLHERMSWAARLAWCQWSMDEIGDGTAWEHLKGLMPA